jgi:hypothetical protein
VESVNLTGRTKVRDIERPRRQILEPKWNLDRPTECAAKAQAVIFSNYFNCLVWYRHPGSNGGPLDPQSSALTN